MRRLKYIETSNMKVVQCDCRRVTGIDISILHRMKTDYFTCPKCKKEMNIRRYFNKYMPKEVK